MRVVLDTNIFISGIFWRGDSEKILYALAYKKFELISSEEIIEEVINTLMNFRIPLSVKDILLWLSILLWKTTMIEPKERMDVVKEDPDDNKFIEVAIAGKANYIISQDNHLLKLKEFRNIKILTPKEFLNLLK